MFLAESVKLAKAHHAAAFEFAKSRGVGFFPERVRLVHVYYIALEHLFETGKLPKGMFRNDAPGEKAAFQDRWS